MNRRLPYILSLCAIGAASASMLATDSLTASFRGKDADTNKKEEKGRFHIVPGSMLHSSTKMIGNAFNQPSSVRRAFKQMARIPAASNLADAPLLYGFNYTEDNWQSITKSPRQIFSFHGAAGMELLQESAFGAIDNPMSACYSNGKFYMIYSSNWEDADWQTYSKMTIDVYDATTWVKLDTLVIADGEPGWDYFGRQVAAVDPESGKLFTVTWGEGKPLMSIDLNTKESTKIGPTNIFAQTIFFDDKGNLYAIDYSDKSLYSLDVNTGEATLIGELDLPFGITASPMSAVYDPVRGRAYWVAVNSSSMESALFAVNPADATTEKISDMGDNEHILGLYMPETASDAPAAPTGISFANGNILLTLPSTTYTTGNALSGQLKVIATDQYGKTFEGTGNPGEQITIPVNPADGKYYFKIRVEGNGKLSPERRLDTFVGLDIPAAVNDLELTIDDGKTAKVTWSAPTRSVNGAAIPDEEISYRIVRYPDMTVMAEGYKETSFTDQIPEAHGHYYYEVTAFAADREGRSANTNVVTAGKYWIAPYTETFDTQADFDSFVVDDANGDLQTWGFMCPEGEPSGEAYLHGNGTANPWTGEYFGNGNDDYLISPFLKLEAGKDYRISFQTYENMLNKEYLTVLLGKERKVAGDETVLFKTAELESNSDYTFIFSVPESGEYTLLFHGDNPGQSVSVVIDNISFDEYAAFNGPDCVTGLTASAADLGELSNTLEFTAPTATYKGETLSSIDRISIHRDGSVRPVKVFENPAPGEKISWTDTDVKNGNVTYRILPYNAAGQGKEAIITNWVGIDEPSEVSNFRLRMNENGKAEATFSASTGRGKHGGYVNNDDVTYALYRYNEYNWDNHWEQATPFGKELSLVDNDKEIYWGQEYVSYMMVAANEAGQSNGVINGVVLGEPYAMPYLESFPWSYASQAPWTLFAQSYNYAWNMTNGDGLPVKPYDADQGMLMFSYIDEESNTQNIAGPRITLGGSTAPELAFQMHHGFEAEPEDLLLNVWVNYEDEGWSVIETIPYNNGIAGWARYAIPLSSDKKDVQIAFSAYAADASASIYIDAITIGESNEKNLAVLSTDLSSKRVEPGTDVTLNVSVANYGSKTAEGAKVNLKINDDETMTKDLPAMPRNAVETVSFVIPTDRTMASNTYMLAASVAFDGDADESDNEAIHKSFFVKGSSMPVPEKLVARQNGGDVALTWEKPAESTMQDAVTDDFDSYESFIIENIGDWTTYDGDGTPTVYFGGPEIPFAYAAKAWQVWAPEEAGFSLETFDVLTPKSGAKYLACWAASDGYSTTLPNDDWLISSEVVGGSEVSFWYRMPNAGSDPQVFEMLYSTTDRDPESFTVFDSDAITFGTDWVYFEYTLPADAKYFAIRSCSQGNYTVALLDDITYTPLYGSSSELTLEGYNVYRDNELIASKVAGTEYADKSFVGGSTHVYNVTAVWKEGESNYSEPYTLTTTGVADLMTGAVKVKGLQGMIAISGAHGMPVSITSLAGMTVAASADGSVDSFRVEKGVYLVKVGNRAFKVVVR